MEITAQVGATVTENPQPEVNCKPPEEPPSPPSPPPLETEKEKEKTPPPGINAEGSKGQINQPGSMRDAHSHYEEYSARNIYRTQQIINGILPEGFFNQQNQPDESKPLIELTSELPPAGPDTCCLQSTLIQEYFDALKSSRLLLISCADKQIATGSAYAIVELMRQADTSLQRRFLDFERIARNNVWPSIFILRAASETGDEDNQESSEVVIVIDTIDRHQDPKAQQFLNSLTATSFPVFRSDLQRKRVSLLCLVDAENIQARVRTTIDGQTFEDALPFPHWEVPFLRALLKQHFPDTYEQVQTKIEQQRERWSTNNRRFWIDIKDLIKRKELLSLLEKPYPPDNVSIESLFKDDDINQDIRQVVLFVATFCPNLNLREFNRVVSLLLRDRTRTITVTSTKLNDKGVAEPVEVEKEQALLEIWQQHSDKIKAECHLHSVPDTEITRVVDFDDHRLRPLLKQYFEQDCAFFTSTHIERLFEAGLLFDTSARIAENLIAITAAAAASDPDYATERLLDTITRFQCSLTAEDAKPIHEITPFQLLADLVAAEATQRVFNRVSTLLRTLLDEYKLQPSIHSLLEQLIRRKVYAAVFKIIVRLRFTQGFDEFHWLKQLIERGDDDVKVETLVYLHGYLRSMGTRVYQVLAGLDGWLPKYENKKEPSPARHPTPTVSGKYALSLLLVYCLDSTERLEIADYGAWPSRHPLFVFSDVDSATTNLGLLARWLFHPWMKATFPGEEEPGDINDLIGDLIYEWVLVLMRPPDEDDEKARTEKPTTGPDAATVNRILIQQVVASANKEQRQRMLARWQDLCALMIRLIKELPYGDQTREAMIWRRNLLDDLVAQFKDCAEATEESRAA